MKRTEPRVVRSRATKLYRLGDDIDDVGVGFNPFDAFFRNHGSQSEKKLLPPRLALGLSSLRGISCPVL